MKPVDFGLAFMSMMLELALRKNYTNKGYVWNIVSLCLHLWGFNLNEVDETRHAFLDIINEKRRYDESAGKIELLKFIKENHERKLLFVTHMATVASSQSGEVTEDQFSFMGSFIATFEINQSDAEYALGRGEDLASAIRFIVNSEIENDEIE